MRDDENWQKYIKSIILPVVKLEKGKLCQDKEEERSNSSFGNIFGENEFDFGKLAASNGDDRESPTEAKNEEDGDAPAQNQGNFLQNILNHKLRDPRKRASDSIETDERD